MPNFAPDRRYMQIRYLQHNVQEDQGREFSMASIPPMPHLPSMMSGKQSSPLNDCISGQCTVNYCRSH